MSESIRRKILLGVLLPIPLLGAVCVLLLWQISRWQNETNWIEHSSDVLAECYNAQKLLIDQETGVRGYLLAGDPAFLAPYESGVVAYKAAFERLSALLSGNAAQNAGQQERLNQIRTAYEPWLHDLTAARDAGATDRETTLTLARSRKARMDSMRDAFGEIIQQEKALLAERRQEEEESSKILLTVAPVLLLAAALALVWFIRRLVTRIESAYQQALAERDRTLRTEKEARTAAEALAEEVTERGREMERVFTGVRTERDQALQRLSELGEAET